MSGTACKEMGEADTLVLPSCTATVTTNNVPVTGNPQWTNNLNYPVKTVTP
jgi:hypothetical protein